MLVACSEENRFVVVVFRCFQCHQVVVVVAAFVTQYDFNGINKYNVIVLHDDKTIEMYNMKGQKPESWKGISSAETIKSLPERIIVGGKSFWGVRTSVQTQIYPFTGGEPLVDFEKDKKIRPDSEVKVIDITSVEVECYDGKRRTVKLK